MMEYKICSRCNEIKLTNEFRNKRNQCKKCEKELMVEWRKNNKDYIKEYNRKYFQEHKEEILNNKKEYMYEYRQTEKYKKHKKEYASNNREKSNLQAKERYKKDRTYKLKHNIRVELLRSFKSKGKTKNKHTEELLGCKLDFAYDHLLKTYKENYGIEWNGVEKVHIDHKKPLAQANTENEIIKLCHYTNLQLLKEVDNLKKWKKFNTNLND